MGKRFPFDVLFSPAANREVAAMRAFDRSRVLAAIESNLIFDPLESSRRRKNLGAIKASFSYVPPLRELKVGDSRVFYTVHEQARLVLILSVRRKPPGMTTEEVLE